MPESLDSVARAALLEITPLETIGSVVSTTPGDDGLVTVLFDSALPGYPGWKWAVALVQLDAAEPTVLETELVPGDGSLLAPDWVPWSDRLAEYKAAQAETDALAAEAEVDALHGSDDSDSDDSDELGDESDDEEYDADLDDDADADSDDDPDSDDDDDDFGSDVLHAGDLDGVDIDSLDVSDEDDSDSDSDESDDDEAEGDADEDDSDGDSEDDESAADESDNSTER